MNLEKLAALRMLVKELPVSAPLEAYKLSSSFGERIDPINGHSSQHTGVDLKASYMSPVYATAAGVVTYSGYRGGYGKVVEITTAMAFLPAMRICTDRPYRSATGSRCTAR